MSHTVRFAEEGKGTSLKTGRATVPVSTSLSVVSSRSGDASAAVCFLFHRPVSSSSVCVRRKILLWSGFQQGPLGAPGDAGLPGRPGPKGLQGPKVRVQRDPSGLVSSFFQSSCSYMSSSFTCVTSCLQGGKGDAGSEGEKVRKVEGALRCFSRFCVM